MSHLGVVRVFRIPDSRPLMSQVIFSVSDFECLMDTFCVRVNKYDLNQDKAL